MTDLSPRGRALVSAGKRAFLPSGEERSRVVDALRVELGDAALPSSGGAVSSAASATRKLWVLASVTVVGAGIWGATLLLKRHPGPDRPAKTIAASIATVTPELEPPATGFPVSPADRQVIAPAAAPVSVRRQQDQLAAEVAILSRATQALHAGQIDQALTALDEHRRKFPTGLLLEEEGAARAQALCTLGRFDEAKASLAGLAPKSPLVARATRFCATASTRHH